MPSSDALLGKRVGNYKLLRSLGVGGMGAVYLGENQEIQSRVAIKVLLPRFVENAQMTRRFFDEARAVNRIGHPGIVRIHDCGRQEDIGVFLIMELLEGKTLDEHLHAEGTFSEERAVRLLRQTASAVAASHQAGIIHRDLKPSNLFLIPDPEVPGGERVKVLDFGIAKLLEEQEAESRKSTLTGMVLGSLLFMSPEQGVDTKRVDARTDVYSLGAIGYHLLSGGVPFEAETLGQLVLKQQHSEPPPLRTVAPEVSERLEAVVHRAIAVDPERRFASMTSLRDALDELRGVPASSSAPGRPVPNMATVSDARPGVTTLSGTAGEMVKLGAGVGRRRLIIGGALALLLAGGFIVWRATGQGGSAPVPGPVAAGAGAPGGAAPARQEPDAGGPSKPDLAAPDLTAPDTARPAHRAKPRRPRRRRLPARTRPRRPRPKPRPAPKAQPKGPQDAAKDPPKDEGKKNYFNEL